MPRSLSVIFSFCALYWPGFTAWPDWLLLILPVLPSEMYFRAYLLASHLLDLIKGLVEVVLTTLVALVVVHDCFTSLVTCASVDTEV
jgi:hypothetical protein